MMAAGVAGGQIRVPEIPVEDAKVLAKQAAELDGVLAELTEKAGESTVTLYNTRGRLCHAMVIGEEKVVAKWSDLVRKGTIYADMEDGTSVVVEAEGYYRDQDLVILKVPGLQAPVVKWGAGEKLKEGTMLVSATAKGRASAVGVVSVGTRDLRAAEQGFLGVEMDTRWRGEGVRIRAVTPGKGAHAAGMLAGDVIVSVGGDEIAGLTELQTRIRRFRAGDEVEVQVLRGDEEVTLNPKLTGIDERILPGESRRIREMDIRSGGLSKVRDGFPSVLQTDLELEPHHSGSPVVNLKGEVVGMVIARASRVSTLVLPAEEIERVLKTEPYRPGKEKVK